MLARAAGADDQPQPWRDVSFVGGTSLPLTAEETRRVRDDLRAALVSRRATYRCPARCSWTARERATGTGATDRSGWARRALIGDGQATSSTASPGTPARARRASLVSNVELVASARPT